MLGFVTGLRALLASQYAMQTSAQNIANANTEGYSRQQVVLKSSLPTRWKSFLVGTGVEVGDITRVVDELLDIRIHSQLQYVGHYAPSIWLCGTSKARSPACRFANCSGDDHIRCWPIFKKASMWQANRFLKWLMKRYECWKPEVIDI